MTTRTAIRVALLGLVLAYVIGWVLHNLQDHSVAGPVGHGAPMEPVDPQADYLRDATLAAPFVIGVLVLATAATRRLVVRLAISDVSPRAGLLFATVAAVATAVASVPGVAAHGWLFGADLNGMSAAAHFTGVALVALRYTFALALGYALIFGVPWATTTPHTTQPRRTESTDPEVIPC